MFILGFFAGFLVLFCTIVASLMINSFPALDPASLKKVAQNIDQKVSKPKGEILENKPDTDAIILDLFGKDSLLKDDEEI